ncbi:uncharacterized protein J3R85_009730 [Psidium guajava]|nr:uncharacterized protein J3R85_009730 [Psidium guajava]
MGAGSTMGSTGHRWICVAQRPKRADQSVFELAQRQPTYAHVGIVLLLPSGARPPVADPAKRGPANIHIQPVVWLIFRFEERLKIQTIRCHVGPASLYRRLTRAISF